MVRFEIRDSYDDQRSPKPFKIRRAFTPPLAERGSVGSRCLGGE
jgi:hypothetical protein